MDNEESWLYGGGGGEEDQAEGGEIRTDNPESGSKEVQEINLDEEDSSAPLELQGDVDGDAVNDESQEEPNGDEQAAGEANEDEEDSDDDDDSDDDGFKITIDKDKIDEAKTTYQTFGLSKPVRAAPTEKKGKFSVEEFDQIGMINGQLATDLDLEGIEDKPWRLPGSDLSDYFNYGFTEETWNAYCQRQRRMRTGESGVGMPTTAGVPMTSHLAGQTSATLAPKIIPSSTFSGGQIPTLGMASSNGSANRIPTRVPDTTSVPPPVVGLHQPPPVVASPASIAVMTSDKRIYSNKSVIDFSIPPPGISGFVPAGPPPTFDAPPPKLEGLPPGLVPLGIPPPPIGDFVVEDPFDFSYGGYEPTQESQWSLPPPAESFHPKPTSGDVPPGDPSYDDRGEHDVWGRHHSSRDREQSPRARSYERRGAAVVADYGDSASSSRRRRRSRSRSRDRYDRHRERESREKRDRDRGERRRTRSRSPRSPSGSERHKHKKSKKDSKREDRRGDKVEIKKEREDD